MSLLEGHSGAPPIARGRAVFELHCAPCHLPSGGGGYLGPAARPPVVAGADVTTIVEHVRNGKGQMPAFSPAVLTDASLQDLVAYLHELPVARGEEPRRLGPSELDPFLVGWIAWGALLLLALCLRAVFAEKRR